MFQLENLQVLDWDAGSGCLPGKAAVRGAPCSDSMADGADYCVLLISRT